MEKLKAIGLAAVIMLLAVLAFGTATAEAFQKNADDTIRVEKGDRLWNIARAIWGVGRHSKEIAAENKLKNADLIHPGQILVVPVLEKVEITASGRAPFGANAEKGSQKILSAIDQTDYSADVKDCLKKSVRKNDPIDGKIEKGESFDYSTDKFGFYGPGNFVHMKEVAAKRWHEECESAWQRIICDQAVARTCGNWYPRCITEPKMPTVTETTEPPVRYKPPVSEFPPPPVFDGPPAEFPPPPVFDGRRAIRRDKFDGYLGYGQYDESHPDQDAWGYYAWAKARWRPIWIDLGKEYSLGLGVFAFGALGAGHDRDYHYNWWEGEVGTTEKIVGPHFDIDLDQGIGWLRNQGGVKKYRGWQEENTLLLSGHLNEYARRDAGKTLLPKREFNFEYRLTYNTHHGHRWGKDKLEPNAADNRRREVMFTQWLADIKKNHWLISPGFNLGYGREYWVQNNRGKDYVQFGPAVQVSAYGEDVIQFNVFNYKEQLRGGGDQWHPISGWVSLDGVVSAIEASQISPATSQDIENRLKKDTKEKEVTERSESSNPSGMSPEETN